MGASESALSNPRAPGDEITTVSERLESIDPVLEKLKSLKITAPILTSQPGEGSLSDILVRKSSSAPATVDPKVLLELISIYRDWQQEKAQNISKKQEEVENKIEVADALAVKLLQRFNYSVSVMKTTSQNLAEVHALQVELGELKGRLNEVISNTDALCKRICTEGPETIRSSIKPFAITVGNSSFNQSTSPEQRVADESPSPAPTDQSLD